MTYQVGIQYTLFKKGGSWRQAFFNALAPPTLALMSDAKLLDWASDIVKDMHPDDLVMIDEVNRNGPVTGTHRFEA